MSNISISIRPVTGGWIGQVDTDKQLGEEIVFTHVDEIASWIAINIPKKGE